MRKRKLFLVRENFQLKIVLLYIFILVCGILGVTVFIYRILADIVEKAAFSAHLSYASSGELFLGTILRTNLVVGGVSVLVLLFIIGFLHIYLNKIFYSLQKGIKHMAQGTYTHRITTKGKWLGKELLHDYNLVAESLDKKKTEKIALIHSALHADLRSNDFCQEIQNINTQIQFLSATQVL